MKVAYLKTKSAVILWNLAAIEHEMDMHRSSFKVQRMPVVNLLGLYRLGDVDWSGVNLGVLPIVAVFSKDKYCVLSGGEQIEKAKMLGFWDINCYVLTPSQHKKHILDYSEEAYQCALSEYWGEEE